MCGFFCLIGCAVIDVDDEHNGYDLNDNNDDEEEGNGNDYDGWM
jgi:hypothetical protein